jgi:YVTN family beta-propeller protein
MPVKFNQNRVSGRKLLSVGIAVGLGLGLAVGMALPASASTTSWNVVNTYTGFTAPGSVWVDHAAGTMYATDVTDNAVDVYNIATGAVTDTIPVGATPIEITFNPNNGDLYVGNRNSNTISVISTATNAVIDTISTPQQAGYGIAGEVGIDVTTNRLYIPVLADGYDEQLWVIDGTTNTVVDKIEGDQGGQYGLTVDEASNMVYVASQNSNGIAIYDGSTNTYEGLISLGATFRQPQSVRFDPTNDKLYVGNAVGTTMSVIDLSTATPTVLPDVELGATSGALAVDPATNTVFITTGTNAVTVIDGSADTVEKTLPTGASPYFVYWDATDSSAYVAGFTGTTVTRIAQGTSPTITSLTAPDATVTKPYSFQLTATGTTPITYSVTSGVLPAGLTLNGATGLISGTPAASGDYSFQITADNTFAPADTRTYALHVAALDPPVITTATLPDGTAGTAYSQTIASTGLGPITFAVTAGSLPAGLTLDPSTGAISGTPTASGSSAFTVTATNADGSDPQSYTLAIDPAAIVTPTPTPTGGGAVVLAYSGSNIPWGLVVGGILLLLAGVGATAAAGLIQARRARTRF